MFKIIFKLQSAMSQISFVRNRVNKKVYLWESCNAES